MNWFSNWIFKLFNIFCLAVSFKNFYSFLCYKLSQLKILKKFLFMADWLYKNHLIKLILYFYTINLRFFITNWLIFFKTIVNTWYFKILKRNIHYFKDSNELSKLILINKITLFMQRKFSYWLFRIAAMHFSFKFLHFIIKWMVTGSI